MVPAWKRMEVVLEFLQLTLVQVCIRRAGNCFWVVLFSVEFSRGGVQAFQGFSDPFPGSALEQGWLIRS